MKYLAIISIVFLLPGFQCYKNPPDDCLRDLVFTEVQTPASVAAGSPIISSIKSSGADLCYMFAYADIRRVRDNEYEVRARAYYPCTPANCPQAIYNSDTTAIINTVSPGQYILKFFSENTLFQSDTVIVN